jgi:hypothetical protein
MISERAGRDCRGSVSGVVGPGGFARAAVNVDAGAKSQMSALIAVLLVTLAVNLLTKLFYYIPMCALAALISVGHKEAQKRVNFTRSLSLVLAAPAVKAKMSPSPGLTGVRLKPFLAPLRQVAVSSSLDFKPYYDAYSCQTEVKRTLVLAISRGVAVAPSLTMMHPLVPWRGSGLPRAGGDLGRDANLRHRQGHLHRHRLLGVLPPPAELLPGPQAPGWVGHSREATPMRPAASALSFAAFTEAQKDFVSRARIQCMHPQ